MRRWGLNEMWAHSVAPLNFGRIIEPRRNPLIVKRGHSLASCCPLRFFFVSFFSFPFLFSFIFFCLSDDSVKWKTTRLPLVLWSSVNGRVWWKQPMQTPMIIIATWQSYPWQRTMHRWLKWKMSSENPTRPVFSTSKVWQSNSIQVRGRRADVFYVL